MYKISGNYFYMWVSGKINIQKATFYLLSESLYFMSKIYIFKFIYRWQCSYEDLLKKKKANVK